MRLILLTVAVTTLLLSSCKKKTDSLCGGINDQFIPFSIYENPVWHPNGVLLGFNWSPLAGVGKNGAPPCVEYLNSVKTDSIGFYIIKSDGTGLKRITKFPLIAPSWSPDGKWLAFTFGGQICKMPFDGNTFDTSKTIVLTHDGANFYPAWTADSDTIYFDSDAPNPSKPYVICKMAADGSGKAFFAGSGRQPFVGSDDRIYYFGGNDGSQEIFSMKKDGSDIKQLTFNSKSIARQNLKYYHESLYYWDAGWLYSTSVSDFSPHKIVLCYDDGYDISRQGDILFATFEFPVQDIRFCTLWISNIALGNKIQVTFNHN